MAQMRSKRRCSYEGRWGRCRNWASECGVYPSRCRPHQNYDQGCFKSRTTKLRRPARKTQKQLFSRLQRKPSYPYRAYSKLPPKKRPSRPAKPKPPAIDKGPGSVHELCDVLNRAVLGIYLNCPCGATIYLRDELIRSPTNGGGLGPLSISAPAPLACLCGLRLGLKVGFGLKKRAEDPIFSNLTGFV